MNNNDNNGWTAPPGDLSIDSANENYYRALTIPWKEVLEFIKKYPLKEKNEWKSKS